MLMIQRFRNAQFNKVTSMTLRFLSEEAGTPKKTRKPKKDDVLIADRDEFIDTWKAHFNQNSKKSISKNDFSKLLDSFTESITNLARNEGKEVRLTKFGAFSLSLIKERKGKGKDSDDDESDHSDDKSQRTVYKSIKFKPSKFLRSSENGAVIDENTTKDI